MNRTTSEYPGRDLEAMVFAENYHRWIARHFSPYVRGTVGEVGAGTGLFTRELVTPQVDRLIAIEPAENLHTALRAALAGAGRITTLNGNLHDVPSLQGRFDSLVYCNVLEHIQDDFAESALCARALKPGGALCVFVPALPCLMSDFDRSIGHFRRYTRGRLRAMSESAGLEVVRLRWFDSVGILPWLVAMTWLKRGLAPRAVMAYDRWVVPGLMRVESLIAPPIGKNLLMVARRPERA